MRLVAHPHQVEGLAVAVQQYFAQAATDRWCLHCDTVLILGSTAIGYFAKIASTRLNAFSAAARGVILFSSVYRQYLTVHKAG
jgi:hypothetical protein